eukprot:TRINITY_DN18601_c0_g2_i1.p1 TRINITY_DN18601_c0_g2~~TRINITY_DN18601_c0_g2_i1.p1  ORF type:complete len:472 (-),score=98.32 TRINITY_DN18601_c0_g2_i1:352-1767(-)
MPDKRRATVGLYNLSTPNSEPDARANSKASLGGALRKASRAGTLATKPRQLAPLPKETADIGDGLSDAVVKRRIFTDARKRMNTLRTISLEAVEDDSDDDPKEKVEDGSIIDMAKGIANPNSAADGEMRSSRQDTRRPTALALKKAAGAVRDSVKDCHAARRALLAFSSAGSDGRSQEERLQEKADMEALLQNLENAAGGSQEEAEDASVESMIQHCQQLMDQLDPSTFGDSVEELQQMLKRLSLMTDNALKDSRDSSCAIGSLTASLQTARQDILALSSRIRARACRSAIRKVINLRRATTGTFGTPLEAHTEKQGEQEEGQESSIVTVEAQPDEKTAEKAAEEAAEGSQRRRLCKSITLSWDEYGVTCPSSARTSRRAPLSLNVGNGKSVDVAIPGGGGGITLHGKNVWSDSLPAPIRPVRQRAWTEGPPPQTAPPESRFLLPRNGFQVGDASSSVRPNFANWCRIDEV